MELETTILKNLIHNEDYARKVLPFLKEEYFQRPQIKILFNQIRSFIIKYNNRPSNESLLITVDGLEKVRQEDVDEVKKVLSEIDTNKDEKSDQEWLIDSTEKFCQEKAIYNAVLESIGILDDKEGKKTKGAIPQILTDALAIGFDSHVGHDFLQDAEQRFDFYHRIEKRIPFDIDYLNKITKGGLPPKTLNIFMGGTGVGKTLSMCHFSAAWLSQGYNVLYITLEMAEERIAERIDANLLNVSLDDLIALPKDLYDKKIERLRATTKGKLIIKEYPTASASTIHFRTLLNELNLKLSFKPDIIVVDYLSICCSARIRMGATVNSYTYVKAIAEELRGLAVEFNVPVVSGAQINRAGFASSDTELTDTSESFGLPFTADFMGVFISTEELEKLGQIMYKQLKNRYGDIAIDKRFILGLDKQHMRLYNVDMVAQKGVVDSGQNTPVVMEKTAFGKRLSTEGFKV